jgi:predicted nucleic acid-binding protein
LIVVDASALTEWLMGTPTGARVDARMFAPGETLYAPELLYVEVMHSLRRLVRTQALSISRAEESLDDLLDLRVKHFPEMLVLRRVWELRNSLSSYDAVYVSIAETLEAPLLTCDRKLASTHGHCARVELF